MTDNCTTDFARINFNKLIVAIAVELVLKLVISKMKKIWLGSIKNNFVFSGYYFVMKNEIECHIALIVFSGDSEGRRIGMAQIYIYVLLYFLLKAATFDFSS